MHFIVLRKNNVCVEPKEKAGLLRTRQYDTIYVDTVAINAAFATNRKLSMQFFES